MSHPALEQFLRNFSMLAEKDRAVLGEKLVVQHYPKGTILQKEGEIPLHCFFVLQGCLRKYQIVDGLEKTTDFFTEDHGAVSSDCYANRTPSYFFLECVEDATLMVGNHALDQELLAEFPVLKAITSQMMEQEWLKAQSELANFKLSSPEKRYLDLLEKRPNLFHRVPNHQIASYLGITPESLSRIRKRVLTKLRS